MFGIKIHSVIKCQVGTSSNSIPPTLGVKVQNMKMDFNTGGTWGWVGQ